MIEAQQLLYLLAQLRADPVAIEVLRPLLLVEIGDFKEEVLKPVYHPSHSA